MAQLILLVIKTGLGRAHYLPIFSPMIIAQKKKWFVFLFIFMQLALKSSGQVVTQTYLDPCSLKTYVVSIPIQSNSGVLVIVRDKSKVFTYSQFASGEVDTWIKNIFAAAFCDL